MQSLFHKSLLHTPPLTVPTSPLLATKPIPSVRYQNIPAKELLGLIKEERNHILKEL